MTTAPKPETPSKTEEKVPEKVPEQATEEKKQVPAQKSTESTSEKFAARIAVLQKQANQPPAPANSQVHKFLGTNQKQNPPAKQARDRQLPQPKSQPLEDSKTILLSTLTIDN